MASIPPLWQAILHAMIRGVLTGSLVGVVIAGVIWEFDRSLGGILYIVFGAVIAIALVLSGLYGMAERQIDTQDHGRYD